MKNTRKYFGTDGIRGLANAEPMTAEIALKLGMAAGRYFLRGDHRHRVVIAKDTRLSGYMIEPALTAGFISVGMDVVLVGPMPTPAVAMLTRSLRADMGVMISASHNPYFDNGIKLFGPDGYKLSDDAELEIEDLMQNPVPEALAQPDKLGRAKRLDDVHGRYIEYVKSTFPKHLRLDGLKIVLDCANGAAYQVAPMILWELGATVIPLGVKPDGFNINRDCGSTYPKLMCDAVKEHDADIGIALDGDADRLVMCDESGHLLDGDALMALVATYWQKTDQLRGGGIVATEMSNMGLEKYLSSISLTLHRAQVGDRYVIEKMRLHGLNVGGEQSGHIVLSDFATTGDGLMAALQILALLVEERKPLSTASRMFTPYPQLLKNIRYSSVNPLDNAEVQKAISAAKESLGNKGRIFIRKSGTEPLIRVMVEAEDAGVTESICTSLHDMITEHVRTHS
jgi:phosphoglucosamine mutase